MNLFVVGLLFTAVAADRLENTYLPPVSAKTAGGNGDILTGPASHYGALNEFDVNSNNANNPDAKASILRFENENNGDGSYSYQFETENKIMHQESGELKNAGTDAEAHVVRGSYSYLGADGVMYTVEYVADENGFRATGEHLPTSPPIPEDILKSLELNAEEEARSGNGYPASDNGYTYNKQSEAATGGGNESQGIVVDSASNKYQPPQAVSRQYLRPEIPKYDQYQQRGYKY